MHGAIWMLDSRNVTSQTLQAAATLLGHASQSALAALARDAVRQRFVLSRTLLRAAASAWADCDPSAVVITERRGDAPTITIEARNGQFISLSHSGPWIACVVGAAPVGVDVEVTDRPRDVRALSAAFFSAAEHEWLLCQPDMAAAFYRLWTGKEAVFKVAHAMGSATDLLDIRFSVLEGTLDIPLPARSLCFVQPARALACSLASSNEDAAPAEASNIRWVDAADLVEHAGA